VTYTYDSRADAIAAHNDGIRRSRDAYHAREAVLDKRCPDCGNTKAKDADLCLRCRNLLADPPGPWQDHAACGDNLVPDAWFPLPNRGNAARALEVCKRCPVVAPCLAYALKHRIAEGVWGGMAEDERAALLRRGGA